jgi:hypothetical protein
VHFFLSLSISYDEFDTTEWIRRLTVDNVMRSMAEYIPTVYELEQFLRIAANAKLHQKFVEDYETLLLLKETNSTNLLFFPSQVNINQTELKKEIERLSFPAPQTIIDHLIEKGIFCISFLLFDFVLIKICIYYFV